MKAFVEPKMEINALQVENVMYVSPDPEEDETSRD